MSKQRRRKNSRYTMPERLRILRDIEVRRLQGETVKEILTDFTISEPTYYSWRNLLKDVSPHTKPREMSALDQQDNADTLQRLREENQRLRDAFIRLVLEVKSKDVATKALQLAM